MFWWMAAARGSIKMVNNSGESAHPCLVPKPYRSNVENRNF